VASIFNQIPSKGEVAGITAYMSYVMDVDLWTLLKRGLHFFGFLGSGGGVGSSVLAQIVERVKMLPDN